MDEMTKRNAALVQQAGAAAESLQQQAATLGHSVAVFKLPDSPLAQSELRRIHVQNQA